MVPAGAIHAELCRRPGLVARLLLLHRTEELRLFEHTADECLPLTLEAMRCPWPWDLRVEMDGSERLRRQRQQTLVGHKHCMRPRPAPGQRIVSRPQRSHRHRLWKRVEMVLPAVHRSVVRELVSDA